MQFWYKAAQIKLVEDSIKQIQAARTGMASTKAYSRIIGVLETQLDVLRKGKQKVVNASWEELKMMRKNV